MIRELTGKISHTELTAVTINVNGVGYLVHTSVAGNNFKLDQEVTLHTHLAVRENAMDLYGFLTRDELEIFELLITLPKIGPKSAQQILAQADITLLKEAVRNNDPSYLSKLSGIGKKSAEKIVAGLSDIFERKGLIDDNLGAPNGNGQTPGYISDTIDALVTLGYPEHEARKTIQKIKEDNPELNNSNDALRAALKVLSG